MQVDCRQQRTGGVVPLGQQGGDETEQHVAGAGGGEAAIAVAVYVPASLVSIATRQCDHAAAALEHDGGIEAPGQLQGGGDTVLLDRRGIASEQARGLAWMRREQGVRAA